MLEVMSAGSTDLSRAGNDNDLVLNCWEKSSPLIKELERTVNFAERKCGDLMQQLNFYKQYYEKWMQSERVNNLFNKKKIKNSCKELELTENSSENEFEKVNQYFYKKIKSKITEMNNEISRANKKLSAKADPPKKIEKNDANNGALAIEDRAKESEECKNYENKPCKSEPIITVEQRESQPCLGENQKSQETIKVAKKESSKSMPARNKEAKKKNIIPMKKRFSNLQRYKLRSKSLPQGVRRKFGFGGFFEVFDPKGCRLDSIASKSRTSLKIESSRSLIRSRDKQSRSRRTDSKKDFLGKRKKSSSVCLKNSEVRSSRSKIKNKSDHKKESEKNISKNVKSEAVFSRSRDHETQQRNAMPQGNNMHHQSRDINICQDIVSSRNLTKVSTPQNKYNLNLTTNLTHLISKPNTMIPFFRNPIPFIPCSSTSKTFNLGLNVQQVLSLIKHKRHSVTLQTVIKNGMRATRSITDKIEPTINTLFFSQTTTSHSHVTSTLCPARTCSKDTFSIVTGDLDCRSKCTILKQAQALRSELPNDKNSENFELQSKAEEPVPSNKLERPEDVWVVEQPDDVSREKKSLLRCTCFPSKHCEDYHKILKEYTDWRISPTKTETFTTGAYTSYQPLICEKSEFYQPSQKKTEVTTREGGGEKFELTKVHNDLTNLSRKYSCLQQKLEQKEVDDFKASAEIDAMESELASTEMEIKNILNFYQQLVLLKEKLKSLRVKSGNSGSQPVVQNSQIQRPRKDPLRPTPSMALTKLLRRIQSLQDTIKLLDVP